MSKGLMPAEQLTDDMTGNKISFLYLHREPGKLDQVVHFKQVQVIKVDVQKGEMEVEDAFQTLHIVEIELIYRQVVHVVN